MKAPLLPTHFNTATKSKIIITLIGRSAFLILLVLFSGTALAQITPKENKTILGLAAYSQVSANGYGTQLMPMAFIKKGRISYYAGPVIQKRKLNFSGVQFNFAYSLTGADAPASLQEGFNPNVELYTFVSAVYNYKSFLGKRTLWEENNMSHHSCEDHIDNLSFRSVELYAGIGLKIRFLKNFKWMSCMGVGGYTSLEEKKTSNLYYDKSSVGLILRTGISYDLN